MLLHASTYIQPPVILLVMRTLVLVFLAILFLQSGIDKVTDRQGNLGWLKDHFKNSLFKNVVAPLLGVLTLLEIAAGIFAAFGVVALYAMDNLTYGFYGVLLASISLIALFLGQRLAKDYAGAQSLVSYFILTLLGLLLFADPNPLLN